MELSDILYVRLARLQVNSHRHFGWPFALLTVVRINSRLVNLAVGVFMILGGVGQFFVDHIRPQNVILAVYCFIFGIGTALLEFQIPAVISRYASFMFSFMGRGIFYIFIGMLICGDHWWKYVAGVVVAAIGLGYVALEFVPSIEPPANMREAEPTWGAEQI